MQPSPMLNEEAIRSYKDHIKYIIVKIVENYIKKKYEESPPSSLLTSIESEHPTIELDLNDYLIPNDDGTLSQDAISTLADYKVYIKFIKGTTPNLLHFAVYISNKQITPCSSLPPQPTNINLLEVNPQDEIAFGNSVAKAKYLTRLSDPELEDKINQILNSAQCEVTSDNDKHSGVSITDPDIIHSMQATMQDRDINLQILKDTSQYEQFSSGIEQAKKKLLQQQDEETAIQIQQRIEKIQNKSRLMVKLIDEIHQEIKKKVDNCASIAGVQGILQKLTHPTNCTIPLNIVSTDYSFQIKFVNDTSGQDIVIQLIAVDHQTPAAINVTILLEKIKQYDSTTDIQTLENLEKIFKNINNDEQITQPDETTRQFILKQLENKLESTSAPSTPEPSVNITTGDIEPKTDVAENPNNDHSGGLMSEFDWAKSFENHNKFKFTALTTMPPPIKTSSSIIPKTSQIGYISNKTDHSSNKLVNITNMGVECPPLKKDIEQIEQSDAIRAVLEALVDGKPSLCPFIISPNNAFTEQHLLKILAVLKTQEKLRTNIQLEAARDSAENIKRLIHNYNQDINDQYRAKSPQSIIHCSRPSH